MVFIITWNEGITWWWLRHHDVITVKDDVTLQTDSYCMRSPSIAIISRAKFFFDLKIRNLISY